MAEAFDPYYVWLGIGPEEQPANHYRLLGIRVFEPNLEVIDSAADRQMAHLRTFQQGKNARLSQQLLNKVSAARVCLLNPATKAAYDAQLRTLQRPFPAAGGAALPLATRPDLPVAPPIGSRGQQVTSQAATNWDALIGGDAGPATKGTSTRRLSSSARRKPNNHLVYIISAAAVVLAAGVGLVLYINGMEGEPPPQNAQAAKPVEPQTGKRGNTSAVANSQGPGQPVASPHDVMLAIDWPVADREDARLTIDGKDQSLDAIKLEFPLAPGRHVIQLTRDGFEPIRQTLDIGSQPLPLLTPRWVPKAAVASAHEPTPTPANGGDDAAATQPMKKLPVPSTAELAPIAKQLDETYPSEHVAEKDHALAERLLELADSPGNSSAERYMLFTKAIGLAAGASDFKLAFRGVDALDAAYEIDGFEMKQKLLDDAAMSVTTADQVAAIVAAAEQVIDQAVADERYDTALELAATAKKLAESHHAEARFRKEASDRIARRVRDIEVIQKAAAVAIEAEATLEKSADDPTANLTLGRWYCLYKRDWERGLPLLAKGPDGPFKKLAKQELAVDLHLKPQLDLADGWWDAGQKESGIPRDSARLHAGEIYRLQFPNLQPGLKKTSIDQRIKEIDAIVGQTTPTSLADRSDDNLPRTHWDRFDLGNAKLKRKIAHLTKAANEMVTKDVFTGPIEIEIKARTEQNNIRIYGPRGSSVIFNWEKNPRELRVTRPDGDDRAESGSVATAPVQTLAPNQWHLIRWRMTETGMQVSADGKIVFSEQRGYDLTTPGKVAVHAVDSNVDINHFVVSRVKQSSISPKAASSAAGEIVKSARQGGGGGGAFDEVGPPGTRLVGFHLVDGGAINVLQPMYRGPDGVVAGVSHGGNPGTAIDVIAKDGYAVGAIFVRSGDWVDGLRIVFMRIRGNRLDPSDSYESPWYGGSGGRETKLGGDGSSVVGVFGASGDYIDSIGLNLEKPAAAGTAPPKSASNSETKPGPDAESNHPGRFPRNRWIDVLRLVDTQNDVVRGLWSRDGAEISCQPEEFSRVKLPVILSGGYDLEVEFTRTGGKSDICIVLPVGQTECTAALSANNGEWSGIEIVDGIGIFDPKSPTAIRPGELENGRRYRLLTSARMFKDGTASIDVMLDGRPYLPHWQGKPSSLKVHPAWMLPNSGQPGLGVWKSTATFHSARLRVVSGEAISESEYQKPSFGPQIVKTRWGGGNNWADVSVPVRRAVDEGKTVFAKRDFLGADPTPGWRKHLEITYEKDGQQKGVTIEEDRQWTPQEYAGEGAK